MSNAVMRHTAGMALLVLSVAAAIDTALWQAGLTWTGSVMLWGVVALLAWGSLEEDRDAGSLT